MTRYTEQFNQCLMTLPVTLSVPHQHILEINTMSFDASFYVYFNVFSIRIIILRIPIQIMSCNV